MTVHSNTIQICSGKKRSSECQNIILIFFVSLLKMRPWMSRIFQVLTEQEKSLILREWNNTRTEYPSKKCVHHLFEEQVERAPENIAVIYENDHATYAELNERANRLAHYLVKHGVKEESIVAVFLERSIDMLVGLLAISKAGATYLPLDPIYPKARLEIVLNDARPVVCLTQKSLIDALPQSEAKIFFLDEKKNILMNRPIICLMVIH